MTPWICIRRGAAPILSAAMLLAIPLPANGQETHFVGIYQGSDLTTAALRLEHGGYELSDGTWVDFRNWYHSDWTDMRFEMLTQFSDNFGILWGASTGEYAEKLTIEPSIHLGFIVQQHPTPSTTLSFTASTILWGSLKESPCTADYGAIGGIQAVNCRLAASPLPPAATLNYMAHAAPSRLTLSISFRGRF